MAWSAPDETAVANMAVDVLDDFPIASLSEDTPIGRYLNRNFWRVYDEVLVQFPWNFAKRRKKIAATSTTDDDFGWDYKYPFPADCVRIFPLRTDGQHNNLPIAHEIEGQYILTDAAAPLPVHYLARIENPALWDPLFTRVMAMTLALYGAMNITGKSGYVDKAKGMLQSAWDAATLQQTLSSGTPEKQNREDVINIRGAGLF